MTGGPSQSSVWPVIISETAGIPVKTLPDGEYAGAIGAAKIAVKIQNTKCLFIILINSRVEDLWSDCRAVVDLPHKFRSPLN